jgi:site-specific recombinase XerD
MSTASLLPTSGLVNYFLIHCSARNLSPLTQKYYTGQLAHLIAAHGDTPAEHLTVHDLRTLVASLREKRGWSIGQTNHFITSLKAFFNYLEREELTPTNPAARLERLKTEQHLPDVLTREELKSLLAVIPSGFIGLRNRTMIFALLDTGVRLRELMGLTLPDVDMKTLTLSVFGKGRKARQVPFSPTLARLLAKYLPQRARKAPAHEYALWISREGTPLNYYYLHNALQAYTTTAELPRPIYPHRFRHTFATEYLRNGGSPQMLQRILGHTSQAMTQRYIHLTDTDTAREHRTASPLENWRDLCR